MAECLFNIPETEYTVDYDSLRRVHPSAEYGEKSASGTAFDIDKPSGLQYKIYSVKFYIAKQGTPTGTMKAHLYVATQHGNPDYYIPTGSDVAESEAKAIEDLTEAFQLVEFKFYGVNRYLMTSRTWYCALLEVEAGSTVNDANLIKVAVDSDADHLYNQVAYTNSTWSFNTDRDGILCVHGDFYCYSCGKFNETKECVKDAIQSAIPEGYVSGNWRDDIKDYVRNLPYISVRISPGAIWDVYDRRTPTEESSLIDYSVSIHVFHSNCMEDGEEKGKYAQDVADRIISYFQPAPATPVGVDIFDMMIRESEPARGAHRISRVIIEGRVQIIRID